MKPFTILLSAVTFFLLAFGRPSRAAEEVARVPHNIEGTWRWVFTMPDGATSKPKLVLTMADGSLAGTTSFRPGTETAITNAVLNGDRVRFQVVRQRDGRDIVTTYTGQWSGKTIKGKVESNWAGETQSYDWEAQRVHEGAEGTWKWPVTYRGRKFEMQVELEQDGETLAGSMPGFGRGRRIEIQNGTVKNGEIYFETERGTDEDKIITRYKGKLTGDKIKGTIETTIFGEDRKSDWDAKRVD